MKSMVGTLARYVHARAAEINPMKIQDPARAVTFEGAWTLSLKDKLMDLVLPITKKET